MGSCCSCLNRDSIPDNHPTKFKVPTASSTLSSQHGRLGSSSLEKVKWQAEAVGSLIFLKIRALREPGEEETRPLQRLLVLPRMKKYLNTLAKS